MSDNEDDIPDVQTAQKLVEQFAEIAKTDEAVALLYLLDREWNLEKSISDYFRDVNKEASVDVTENKNGENDAIIVSDDDESNVAAAATAIVSSNLCGEQTSDRAGESNIPKPTVDAIIVSDDDESNVAAAATAIVSSNLCGEQTSDRAGESNILKPTVDAIIVSDDDESNVAAAATAIVSSNLCGEQTSDRAGESNNNRIPTIEFVTWNINGLNDSHRIFRTESVCKMVKTCKPDIVHLQEVVPEILSYIRQKLQDYKCVTSGNDDSKYFIVTLLRIETVKYVSHASIPFPKSIMRRNLLSVTLKIGRITLRTINTHLESCECCAYERMDQLKRSFKHIGNVDTKQSVIFAGDLHLRDSELKHIGGLPDGIEDLWRTCGSRKECEFTWDASKNKNISSNSRFKPRFRFDRVYLRRSEPQTISPKQFGLIISKQIRLSQYFPSDHWGILCMFDINSESR